MNRICVLSFILFLCAVMCVASITNAGVTQRVSVSSGDTEGNNDGDVAIDPVGANKDSDISSISSDGRFVAYASAADNLVSVDTNECWDIFIRDRQANETKLVSVSNDGIQSNGDSDSPSICADGRFVTFASEADNLVSGDTNGCKDIFVYDRQTGITQRVSVADDGTQSNSLSRNPSISADGRFVAFCSFASNLVTGDTNNAGDVFVFDRQTGKIELASVSSDGSPGNSECGGPSISADGRFVAFLSTADNLVSDDTNGYQDIFVHNRVTGETLRASISSEGVQANNYSSYIPSISADGRYVAFASYADNLVPDDVNGYPCFYRGPDVFVHDMLTGRTEIASISSNGEQGDACNSNVGGPSISADGRRVAFESFSTNFASGDTLGTYDIFVHDRQTGMTEQVSVSSAGVPANAHCISPCISADGVFVSFKSMADNLVIGDTNESYDIFVHQLDVPVTGVSLNKTVIALNPGASETLIATVIPSDATNKDVTWSSSNNSIAAVDANGKVVTVGDGICTITVTTVDGGKTATCLVNTYAGITQHVSTSSDGTQADGDSDTPSISADSRFVAFASDAVNLVSGDTNGFTDIFIQDRQTGSVQRLSVSTEGVQANNFSRNPSTSADGRFTAFDSFANNLVPGDANSAGDVFIFDKQTGKTQLVSLSSNGIQANSDSSGPSISADGRFIAFLSGANNLVTDDTNGYQDIFVHDMQTGVTERVSISSEGAQSNNDCYYIPSISADGRFIAFESFADNLVPGDLNGSVCATKGSDVFVHDRLTGRTEIISVSTEGVQGNACNSITEGPSISADGRFVVFCSYSTNLVSDITNWRDNVFIRDRQTGITSQASEPSDGISVYSLCSSASISADGRFVAFLSRADCLVSDDTNGCSDVFVYDRITGKTERVSVSSDGIQSDGDSVSLSISANGRSIAFGSDADNLVPGDTNGFRDIFIHEMGIQVMDISLNKTAIHLNIGASETLIATVIPSDASNKDVTWSSSNDNIASVDTNGKVTAVGDGICTITVTSVDGNRAANCLVNTYARVTQRVSTSSEGTQADGDSDTPSISADSRFVAFASDADNLVSGDTNGFTDIFIQDRQTGSVQRLSISTERAQANNFSRNPSTSADGRFTAFESFADNLVSGDSNSAGDVFIFDKQTSKTQLVSLSSNGIQANSDSSGPSISADGRFIAFLSSANNLVTDDTNGYPDIFVHDMQTGLTERVSISSEGAQANESSMFFPAISANGRFVAFESMASNLVIGDLNGNPCPPRGSDVFVHDRQTGKTEIVSISSEGTQGNMCSSIYERPSISADGRFVLFVSIADNLILGSTYVGEGIFVRDRQTSTTTLVSAPTNGPTMEKYWVYSPSISADGRFVAFRSNAVNLVTDDTNGCNDVFVYDRNTGKTERVSVSNEGIQGNGDSDSLSISANGRSIAFASNADNLVPGDTNGFRDIFVRELGSSGTAVVSGVVTGLDDSGNTTGPLEGACASIDGIETVSSNINGEFTLENLPAGTMTIIVSKPGYVPVTRALMLTEGESRSESFQLIELPNNLTVTINQSSDQADPSSVSPIKFSAVFSKPVTGFIDSDVTIGGTAGATTAVVLNPSGDQMTYAIEVSGMTADGSVIVSIPANVAHDDDENGNEASISIDNTVQFNKPDTTSPSVTINQAAGQKAPTNVSPINFTVVFSESVSDFATGDVSITGTAGGTMTATVTGSGTTYNVAVDGMTSNGTVIASLDAGVAHDAAGNANTASTSRDNTVTYDIVAPVIRISTPSETLTTNGPVSYTITYVGATTVTLAPENITLSKTGTADGTVSVTGSGTATRTVTVSGITGTGKLSITIEAGTASDAVGNISLSEGPSAKFTVDNTSPTVKINQAVGQMSPTNASPINFTVVFSEPVSDFASDDVTISGTAGGTMAADVTGSGTTYNVAISGMASNGTVIASLVAGVAHDAVGNANTTSTSADNTVAYDIIAPIIRFSAPSETSTTNGPIVYTVTYIGASTITLASDDITLIKTGTADGTIEVTGGDATTRTVTISGITGTGKLGISIGAATAMDLAGNVSLAAGPSTRFTVDNTPPSVKINQAPEQISPTNESPVNFTVVFSESVSDFDAGDVTISGTAGGTMIATVTGSGTTYNVAITGMTSNGTVIASLGAGVAHDALGNTSTASTSADNTVKYDIVPPTIRISAPSASSTTSGPVTYTVTYVGAAAITLTSGNITLNPTGTANGTVDVTGSGNATRTVTISGITGTGKLGISIGSGTATDTAGNISTAAGPSSKFSIN